MLYSKWSCSNYGPYYGENTIDLIGDIENKSIVLIRGLNGYGKTSFINGIRLALYGENAHLHNDTEYKHFLKERMNDKAMDEGQRNAYVSIEFIEDNKNSGFINKIQVKREWTLVTEDYANDNIRIIRNGKELQINDDDIQEYLDKIIPKELLQFFAFDAEQIRYTTDDTNFNDSLTNDIAKILDITKYELAYEKLKIYIQKQKNASNKVTGSKVSEIDLNRTRIKEQIEDLNEIIKQMEFEIESLNQQLDRKQRWMDERGYSDNYDINKYETERLKLEERKKVLIESLEQENFSVFPYAILLKDLKILKSELEDEVQNSLRDNNKKFVEEALDQVAEIIEDKNIIPNLLESQIMQIKDYIDLRIKSQFKSYDSPKELIHLNELSQKELDYIMNELNKNIAEIKCFLLSIQNKRKELECTEIKIREQKSILKRLPTKSQFQEQVNQLEELTEIIKIKESELKLKKDELVSLEIELEKLNDQYKKGVAQLEIVAKIKESIEIAQKIQRVLQEYTQVLKKNKTKDIDKYMEEMIGLLSHKTGMISSIEIDDDSFEIILKNYENQIISKRRLSEGEKQIFGLSLTYALAKASKRNFGFIIDTPFAKLDSIHKKNVIEKFIPNIGRQVIILAQDEELKDKYLEDLREYATYEYEIKTDNDNNSQFVLINNEMEGATY